MTSADTDPHLRAVAPADAPPTGDERPDLKPAADVVAGSPEFMGRPVTDIENARRPADFVPKHRAPVLVPWYARLLRRG
jgi:hypothetical protein